MIFWVISGDGRYGPHSCYVTFSALERWAYVEEGYSAVAYQLFPEVLA